MPEHVRVDQKRHASPLAEPSHHLAKPCRSHRAAANLLLTPQLSGSGMNSVSPRTGANRPVFQSSLAWSMRSLREETKFHQM